MRPYPIRPTSEPSDWLVKNPIPQQSAFWTAQMWKQLGPFREGLHFSFDYEYWLRIKFKACVGPHIVNKCLTVGRLHATSKTVAGGTRFEGQDDQVGAERR